MINLYDMKKTASGLLFAAALLCCGRQHLYSQCNNRIDVLGRPCGGTIQTAVPFLRIAPDARSGAMGDAGIALSPDANAVHFNASNLAFAEDKYGFSATYTPWLTNLGLNDIYLGFLSGFYRIGKDNAPQKQAIGFGLKYFSLGNIQWTDEQGTPINEGSPREFEATVSYSRQLSKEFAVAVSGKYVYSNLASGLNPGGGAQVISSGKAGAADFSMTYKDDLKMGDKKTNLTVGLAITNIGNKISYLRTADFLPTNLGIGAAWLIPLDQFNTITFALDLNKLLVPTPDTTGRWRTLSPVAGIFDSFTTAPGGFSEKLQEINYSAGIEYWYDKQFAVRAGYFYENPNKGGRRYLTAGLGLKYNVLGINLSYLVPTTSQRGPLDNTLRFSLLFDASSFKVDNADNAYNNK